MKHNLSLLLFSMLCATPLAAQPQNFGFGGQQIAASDMHCGQKFLDINYAGDDQAYHTLDVYLPEQKADKYPVIVHIYGSAWFSNSSKGTADLGTICSALLKAGYAVVCPNHRASTDARYPAQINDIKAVVRWIRGNADKYGFDSSFIGTSGFSSGAHLAALAAATNGVKVASLNDASYDIEGSVGQYLDQSSDVQACCEWSGPIDLMNMDCAGKRDMQQAPEDVLMGFKYEGHESAYQLLSPIYYLTEQTVPIHVFHGTADNVVPCCQGEQFYHYMDQKNVWGASFTKVEGGGHGFKMYSEQNLGQMVAYFDEARMAQHAVGTFTFKANPMVRDVWTADPAPMVDKGRVYVYTGHDEWYEGQDGASGGKEFNITEWLCFSSTDMKHWINHGSVMRPSAFQWADTISPGVGIAWASQVIERYGKYYYYNAVRGVEPWSGYAVGVAVSDSPTGPFVDPIGKPLVSDKMTDNGTRGWWNDIDPTVLIDDDGQAYLCWGNGTCFMAKLNADMVSLDTTFQAPRPMRYPGAQAAADKTAPYIWTVDVPRFTEGPWLYKRHGLYYLIYASSGFDHQEAIDYAVSKSIMGPWEHKGQITGGGENSFTIHPGVAELGGKTYLFYHNATATIDGRRGAIGRRSVCFDEMKFNPDGTIIRVEQSLDYSCHTPYKRVVEEGGTGAYKAIMTEGVGLEAHTVFMPQDLSAFSAQNPLPVLVWGNGACTNSPWEHYKFLNEIASHGYLVIATGHFPHDEFPYRGPMSTPQQQMESIDWALAQNADSLSPLFGKINTKAVCAAGMSCGGLQTLFNCADPRISAYMICNSGLFKDPSIAMPNMPMPGKDQLLSVHAPILYMLGGPTDIAYDNGMDDFYRIMHQPAIAINYPVGHGGTYRQAHGGEFSIPAVAWLNWQLKGDKNAAKMFRGKKPGILQRQDWTIERNALVK